MRRLRLALMVLVAGCGAPRSEPPAKAPAASEPKPATAVATPEKPRATAPAAPPPPAVPADPEELVRYDPDDPLGDLEKADALDALARGQREAVTPPAGGCAIGQPALRVWGAPALPAIAALGQGFVVAGYETRDGEERVFLAHLPASGPPAPLTSLKLAQPHPGPRRAAPGLSARDDKHLALAVTDGAGKLWLSRLRVDSGGHGGLEEIASGADTRFAPAVAHSGDKVLVVYTEGETPMRARLVVVDNQGNPRARHDLTPPSMGAAAASFVQGAVPPVVIAVDARDGMSPLLRVDLSDAGTPGPPVVAVPVSMVSSPPRLAAAASSMGTYVGYTGVGSAATSAVGLVSIAPIAGTPKALIPGTAYGTLHVSATHAPRALLFAASAPKQPGKDPKQHIQVVVVGRDGQGPATALEGPGGQAQHPAVARDDSGTVAVAYRSGGAVYVALLRCDDA